MYLFIHLSSKHLIKTVVLFSIGTPKSLFGRFFATGGDFLPNLGKSHFLRICFDIEGKKHATKKTCKCVVFSLQGGGNPSESVCEKYAEIFFFESFLFPEVFR